MRINYDKLNLLGHLQVVVLTSSNHLIFVKRTGDCRGSEKMESPPVMPSGKHMENHHLEKGKSTFDHL